MRTMVVRKIRPPNLLLDKMSTKELQPDATIQGLQARLHARILPATIQESNIREENTVTTQISDSLESGNTAIVLHHGVVTLHGYGIQVRVDRGHLLIEDGIGPIREHARFPRVRHGLKRLVVVGSDGMVSLAALRWLADQDASFVMLDRDGSVLATNGPVRPSDARLRRAQALAIHSGVAIEIARELIDHKIAGQERVARHKLLATGTADTISRYRTELVTADSMERLRLIESLAAGSYWSAWRNLPINFPKKQEPRVPDHWRVFGSRISPLTGSPRLAANPPNAILNYLYAVLESESRLAAAALGLDPGIGFLHVDTAARDSLACDLMEPVRPQVDAYLLDWITRDTLNRDWFFEQRDGNCRLMGSFAVLLSQTAQTWGRAVAPIAERVAQALWDTTQKHVRKDRTPPTPLTQRRRSEGRGKQFVPDATPAPHPVKVCAGCGTTTHGGRHCHKCGREICRGKLIELAKLGRVAARSLEVRKKLSETQRRHEAAKRAWRSSVKLDWPDEQTYIREVQPRLPTITISRLSSTLCVSESYAADIRAGRRTPHRRHWNDLAQLVEVLPSR
jgi:CRISPR-associated endonuclease Cas1